jgi:monofunctional biosynthetic peptidoglycan transglycosylase
MNIKKVFWILLKIFGVLFGLLLLNIVWLKFMPVMFTSTMLSRSIEAMTKGESATIYYEWVSYEQISEHAKIAVVASEDQRFPTHSGIDYEAIKVAMEENKHNKIKRGASTISQQVAKNVFLWQGGGWFRKALEVPITYIIEFIWGKKRILEIYLNIAEMGERTFGVQAASKRFLKKSASQLLPAEGARVAAVLPNPRVYSIANPSPIILQKQNIILYWIQLLGGYQYHLGKIR